MEHCACSDTLARASLKKLWSNGLVTRHATTSGWGYQLMKESDGGPSS